MAFPVRAELERGIEGVLGIDPGRSASAPGGLALIGADGRVLGCWTMPTYKTGKGSRMGYDIGECLEVLRTSVSMLPGLVVMLEKLRPFPGQGGAIANYARGESRMLWCALAVAVGVRIEEIGAKAWQKELGVDSGPEASLNRAREMYPREELGLKKHSGRAAALLIAESGRRRLCIPASV